MDAAVERTGMYLQRVQKTCVDQLLYSLVVNPVGAPPLATIYGVNQFSLR